MTGNLERGIDPAVLSNPVQPDGRQASGIPEQSRGRFATDSSLPLLTVETAFRFLYSNRILGMVSNLAGDIVECGVGWGRSLLLWALLVRAEGKGRCVWGFDSFDGFPEPGPEDCSPRNVRRGEWKTDLNSVLKLLRVAGFDNQFVVSKITLVKGFFESSLKKYTGERIAVLSIDADLYRSHLEVLRRLYPKVVEGGVVLFDDYMNSTENHKFPGAKRAIDEYFRGRVRIKRDPLSGKYYLIKK